MGISTILPLARRKSQSRVAGDVLSCLRRQPMVPLDLGVIADSIAGATIADIERAVANLEGPVTEAGEGVYVHYCRLNNQAVYIP